MNSQNLGTRSYTGSYLYSTLPRRRSFEECCCLTIQQHQECPQKYQNEAKVNKFSFVDCTKCFCPDAQFHVQTNCATRMGSLSKKQIRKYKEKYPKKMSFLQIVKRFIFTCEDAQGANITKIYGNGDVVTANAGANGWHAAVPVALPGSTQTMSGSNNEGPAAIPGLAIPTGSGVENVRSAKGAGKPVPTNFKPTTISSRTNGSAIQTFNGHVQDMANTMKSISTLTSATKKTWGSMMDLMDPLLDDPNQEEGFCISDRVSATTSGTTIIQTQDSVPIRTAYLGGTYGPTPSMDVPTVPGPAVERFNNITSGNWSAADAEGTVIYSSGILAALLGGATPVPGVNNSTVFTRTLTNHVLWRSSFDVQLQVNPSQFHQGSLVLVALPAALESFTNISQLFAFPFQILNLRTVNTVRLSLPFVAVTPVADIYEDPWNVAVVVLSPLAAATGTPSTLPFNIVVSPRQTQYQGLNFTQVPLQPTPEPAQHFKVRRTPASNSFGNVVSGQEIEFAAFAPQAPPHHWLPGEVFDWLELARIPTQNGKNILWEQSAEAGTLLEQYEVQPYDPNSPSYMSFIAANFAQYRGPINYYFMFTGARQHYGKLVVCYNPNPFQAPTTMAEAMQGVTTVWDVGLNSTLKFTVPFISSMPWRPTQNTVNLSTGYVTVWVYNQLMGPSNVTNNAQIVSFIGASQEFQLRFPVLPTFYYEKPESAQGGEELTNMETGTVSEAAEAPAEVIIGAYDPVMDTNIAAWFSQYRLWTPTTATWQPATSRHSSESFAMMTIDLSIEALSAASTQFSWMLSIFTYVKGDLKIQIAANQWGIPPPVRIAHIPVGASATNDPLELDSYPQIIWTPTASDLNIAIRIPYNSTNTAVSRHQYTTRQEVKPLSSWGTLVLVTNGSVGNLPVPLFSAAFDGFRCWAPRPFPNAPYVPPSTTVVQTPERQLEKAQMKAVGKMGDFISQLEPTVLTEAFKNVGAVAKTFDDKMIADVVQTTKHGVGGIQDLAGALKSVSDKVTTEQVAEFVDSVKTISGTTEQISEQVTKSLNTFTGFFPTNPIVKLILKVVGYILILTSHPTPQVLMGLAMMGVADLGGSSSVTGILDWFYKKVGISKPEVEQTQTLRDINEIINTARNAKWVVETGYEIVLKILKALKKDVEDSPQKKLEDAVDDIACLHVDSLKVKDLCSVDWDQVDNNILRIREMLKWAKEAKDIVTSRHLYTILSNYLDAKAEAKKNQTGTRTEPLVVYLHGLPGCGKSLVSTLIAAAICKKKGIKYSENVFTPPPNSEYFDGYTGQFIHVIDDLGQMADGSDWATFVNMVSPVPFLPNMAFRKGIPYTSKLIIASSNFTTPNDIQVRSREALERRLHIKVHVEATPTYSHGNGKLLSDEALRSDLNLPSKYFEKNFPLADGRAIKMTMAGKQYTLETLIDHIFTCMTAREDRRTRLLDLIPEIAQGDVKPSVEEEIEKMNPEEYKNAFSTLKQRLVRGWSIALTVMGGIIGLFGIWLLCKPKAKEEAESAYDPTAMKKKKKTPVKPVSTLTVPLERYQNGEFPHEIFNAIDKATFPLMAESYECRTTQSFMGIMDDMYVMNKHTWDAACSFVMRGKSYQKDEIPSWSAPNSDLLYFCLKDQTKVRNMTKFFLPPPPATKFKMNLLSKMYHASHDVFNLDLIDAKIVPATNFRMMPAKRVQIASGEIRVIYNTFSYDTNSYPGMCGSPVVLMNPAGPKIIGTHISGLAGRMGSAEALDATWRTAFVALHPEYGQGEMQILGEAEPIAYVPRVSALKPSPYYGMVTPTKSPAVLRQSDPRLGEGVILDQRIFAKYTGDTCEEWPSFFPACQLYFSKFPRSFEPLSMFEAINGIDGLDGIDMNQSAGYPYVSVGRSRRSFFTVGVDGYYPTIELKNAVMDVLTGNFGKYMTFLKDELRNDEKVEQGKTRIVDAANLPSIIAGRMIFGRLFAYMHKNVGIKHGSAVGCNPDFHWTQFYGEFSKFEEVWDLDYSAYDSSIPTFAFKRLAQCLRQIVNHPSAADYIEHLANTVHVYGSMEYMVKGGMPSGCVGTSIFNTMLNNCFILSALITHPDFNPEQFGMMAYGDDVIYATNPTIHPSFIKQFYDEHTPLTVTPASKDGMFPDTSTIHDVVFLKRWFYPDLMHPGLVRPIINPEVYYQSVMWMRDGDIQDTITSLSYLAFHAGPNNYVNWIKACKTKCEDHYFLPWSYLDLRWYMLCQTGEDPSGNFGGFVW